MLHNSVTKAYYIGYSADLKQRFQDHLAGKNMATKQHHAFWKLVYYEAYVSAKSARLRELQLKAHGKGVAVIKKRIKHDVEEK